MNLNPKQKRFCEEYVVDLNGTQAAIRAGHSKKTAAAIASENLRKPHLAEFIEDLLEKKRERTKFNADMVVEDLQALATWNIQDFITNGNSIKDLSKLSRKTLKPVTGIKSTVRYEMVGKKLMPVVTTEVKFADKRAAEVDLGRHLGVFKEDNQQKQMKIIVKRK